jgi:predicted acetyltransferase
MSHLIHKKTEGPLPTSTFELVSEGKIVGTIQIRHKVSHSPEVPIECASHVYYEIEEKERGKGYGNDILRLGKEKAKELGLKNLIVICLDDNIPSKKIIEANVGVLVGTCITAKDKRMLKYQIEL